MKKSQQIGFGFIFVLMMLVVVLFVYLISWMLVDKLNAPEQQSAHVAAQDIEGLSYLYLKYCNKDKSTCMTYEKSLGPTALKYSIEQTEVNGNNAIVVENEVESLHYGVNFMIMETHLEGEEELDLVDYMIENR